MAQAFRLETEPKIAQLVPEIWERVLGGKNSWVHRLHTVAGRHDDQTANHGQEVAFIAYRMAPHFSLEEDITRAALLHDIGKIVVPPGILNAPRRLTDLEREIVKKHPQLGHDIIDQHDPFVAKLVKAHHGFDGDASYPEQVLKNDPYYVLKELIAVADRVQSLRTPDRPYKDAWPEADVRRLLTETFNPSLVDQGLMHYQELQNGALYKGLRSNSA